jgi:hypothetical protein
MSKTAAIKPITAAAASKQAQNAQQDFWVLYPSATGNGSLAAAMHALCYLPANYKLVVLSNALSRDFMAKAEGSISNRIRFETSAGLSNGTSPFSYADAVIYDGTEPDAAAKTPAVIVSQVAEKALESNAQNGYTISAGNPEALASAVLRIARTTA